MKDFDIHLADDKEKNLAAHLLAGSEPWITLRITEEQCKKNCYDPEYLLYLAFEKEKPAGILLLDPKGVAGSPYIKSIAVFPEFRGKGIGTKLLSFAEDLFSSNSRHLFICVSSFNNRARKLYEKFGFETVGELKDYIIKGASEILMHKGI
ncbi:MAG TPA: N-acetyltransferase [Bacteroidales bacterium]|nr:N-acetyltransferase [Bacteroidales bacterium]HBZ20854.1 N-acetyltransferase [Bacteroidales bacterium]